MAEQALDLVAPPACDWAVRDLMVAAVEHRFGQVNRLPVFIEWLTDNGSCFVARETRRFVRAVGFVPR
ncbi:hypothetical protein mvi_61400 (plasmid) [Methylobacterium indicum]|uniref:Integrase catalytic domain-containing protein n=1 Tax=Methylobacterium indicum TaxID=1775910 RepID=A0A8H8X0E8_9HYPH|nr:hypothetical protein mvi_61400 [Methylobacterium indicum]